MIETVADNSAIIAPPVAPWSALPVRRVVKTRSRIAAVVLALMLSGSEQPLRGDVINGVTIASVSSELTLADGGFDRNADYVVDGSGLFGSQHIRNPTGVMWDADTFDEPFSSTGTDTDPEITFDLGAVYTVESFEVWNFGAVGFSGRGVNEFQLLISDDNVDYASLGSYFLTEAVGSSSYAGEVIDPTNFSARYVRFDIISNHDGDLGFGLGLAEVQFSGAAAVPEPSCLALSAAALGVCCYRRRRSC